MLRKQLRSRAFFLALWARHSVFVHGENIRIGMKLTMSILLLSAGALSQTLFVIRNPKNQKVSAPEAEKIYLSACAVVKREFNRTTVIRPHMTLVLGSPTASVDRDEREIRLSKWDEHLFAQGVVMLAVEDLLTPIERLRVAELAVDWAEATVDVKELKKTQTQGSTVLTNN